MAEANTTALTALNKAIDERNQVFRAWFEHDHALEQQAQKALQDLLGPEWTTTTRDGNVLTAEARREPGRLLVGLGRGRTGSWWAYAELAPGVDWSVWSTWSVPVGSATEHPNVIYACDENPVQALHRLTQVSLAAAERRRGARRADLRDLYHWLTARMTPS